METIRLLTKKISPQQLFMASVMLVNGGNYLYNLLLGRILGPEAFAEAALLITLLLVLSFLGMTFQLTTAKFAVLFQGQKWLVFLQKSLRFSMLCGLAIGILIAIFSGQLQEVFHTGSSRMFVLFALGVPFYFFMSLNRGIYQGREDFTPLSITYQTEMWSRLLLTLLLIYFLDWDPGTLVALGILLSFLFGLFPTEIKSLKRIESAQWEPADQNMVLKFLILTACYELTQILINNSDILLVKHYFEDTSAGLYASLALIGRVVYFAAWMFVMLLLPAVVRRHKEGKSTAPILFKYVSYIGGIALLIVLSCYTFPQTIIQLMFGAEYLDVAPLLWKYALATSLFALSNIFAYYFLSLDQYLPVLLSGLLGLSQIALIIFFHESLEQVIHMQILAMLLLLIMQLFYFIKKEYLGYSPEA